MEEDVCVDDDPDDPDDSMLDDHDDPPPTSSLGDPLEDAKTHYLRLIVGESKGRGWGGPQSVAGASVVTTTTSSSSSYSSTFSPPFSSSQPLAPRVLVAREPLECPSGFMPFHKHQEAAEEEEERTRAQAAVQDDPFGQACDEEVWSCLGPLAGGRTNHAAGGRTNGRTEPTEDARNPTRASSAPKDMEGLPALTRVRIPYT